MGEIKLTEEVFVPGYVECRKLHKQVLVVAKVGYAKDWAAYCGSVAGFNTEVEWHDVADNGDKLPKAIAEALFPHWAKALEYRT
jgi:uncharacterized protein CbrC (UPF0167 family)